MKTSTTAFRPLNSERLRVLPAESFSRKSATFFPMTSSGFVTPAAGFRAASPARERTATALARHRIGFLIGWVLLERGSRHYSGWPARRFRARTLSDAIMAGGVL